LLPTRVDQNERPDSVEALAGSGLAKLAPLATIAPATHYVPYLYSMIALVARFTRARHDSATKAYLARKQAEGKTKREAIRCLKRHLARRFHHILPAPTAPPTDDRRIVTSAPAPTPCLTYRDENPGCRAAVICPAAHVASRVPERWGTVGERRPGRPRFASWAVSPLT
jgi:hypothetical protein